MWITETPSATVADLRKQLAGRHPELVPLMGQMLIAVDTQYAPDDQVLSPTSEVACIPPVSGGRSGSEKLDSPKPLP